MQDVQFWLEEFVVLKLYVGILSVVIVVGLFIFFLFVFGEFVFKWIGFFNFEVIVKVMVCLMKYLLIIIVFFVWLFMVFFDLLIKVFCIKLFIESKVMEEEIKVIIQEGMEGGEIQEIEQDIVECVFYFGDCDIFFFMIYRNDVIFLQISDIVEEICIIVDWEMYLFYFVFDEDCNLVVGVVLLKDFFCYLFEFGFLLVEYIVRFLFVIEYMLVYEVFIYFKILKVYYGIVMDEFGQMQGIVIMKDFLYVLVGDFFDFYFEEFDFFECEDGFWFIDG